MCAIPVIFQSLKPSPTTHHPSPITHHPPPITHYPSPITHHPSPITHHPPPITHHPSPTTHYPWFPIRTSSSVYLLIGLILWSTEISSHKSSKIILNFEISRWRGMSRVGCVVFILRKDLRKIIFYYWLTGWDTKVGVPDWVDEDCPHEHGQPAPQGEAFVRAVPSGRVLLSSQPHSPVHAPPLVRRGGLRHGPSLARCGIGQRTRLMLAATISGAPHPANLSNNLLLLLFSSFFSGLNAKLW